jgi:uncharacterized protein (UPF0276 family)
MAGLGYRREMREWDMSAIQAEFFEVAPENWLQRDRAPLHALRDNGRAVHLHGVSLNLGGHAPLNQAFLRDVRRLMDELRTPHYSDHLAASGDAHQLYDLFPVPFTPAEVRRVGDRIRAAQDILGQRLAIENTTWYTNIAQMPEPAFLMAVAERADCRILLDLNNVVVNERNHGGPSLAAFVAEVDPGRISYLHVAGHEYDPRFELFIDTHSQGVAAETAAMALHLHLAHALPILLEWDHDIPDPNTLNRELACLTPPSSTT